MVKREEICTDGKSRNESKKLRNEDGFRLAGLRRKSKSQQLFIIKIILSNGDNFREGTRLVKFSAWSRFGFKVGLGLECSLGLRLELARPVRHIRHRAFVF